MDYRQKFDNDFSELFSQRLKEKEDFGLELWSAMANVGWFHVSDTSKTDWGRSFRGAGSLIASMLGHGDYVDWYCCSPDGVVSEYIADNMSLRGWKYEIYDNFLDKSFYE